MKTDLTPEFLTDDEGRIYAMQVRLRPGIAVRAVQPNPKCLVFFYLGTDDLPVGLKFLEPVGGVAASRIVNRLLQSADGVPVGVDSDVEHRFWTWADIVERTLRAMRESAQLPQLAPYA